MKTVWRYELAPKDDQVIKMPCGAEPLHVAWRHGQIELWALVDSEEKILWGRTIKARGTGHKIDFALSKFQYVGTVLESSAQGGVPGFVWHVWVEL